MTHLRLRPRTDRGTIERTRVMALAWDYNYTPESDRISPIVFLTDNTATPVPLVTNYGTAYGQGASYSTLIGRLQATEPGRRAVGGQYFNWWIYGDSRDRCQNASGNLNDISAQPVKGTYLYANATGGDAVASGYSSPWCDNFIADIQVWAADFAQLIADGETTLDFIIFDTETGLAPDHINNAHRAAIAADPRFASRAQSRLNYLINIGTGGATTTFNVTTWQTNSSEPHNQAWRAYWKEQQNACHNAVLAGLRTVFPNCSMSNYGDHGRSYLYASLPANGNIGDINGRRDYDTGVSGDWASEHNYGWGNQNGNAKTDGGAANYTTGYWFPYISSDRPGQLGAHNPYHTLIWELNRSMASIRSGFKLKPWVAYPGFDDSDFVLGGIGPTAGTDLCPYWEAHLAAQALMSCIPVWINDEWASPGLLLFSLASGNLEIGIASVDLAENEFITETNSVAWTHKLPPGLLQSLAIAGSTSNDGTYTIEKIYPVGTSLHIKVNEVIPSDTGTMGHIDASTAPESDGLVDDVLAELNTIIGTQMPRYMLTQRDIIVGERDADGAETCSNGNLCEWFGVRVGNNEVYCIVIGRTPTDKTTWAAQDITGYVNGESIGVVGTIAANKAYLYYSRPFDPANPVTGFTWEQDDTPTNLVTEFDLTNTGVWTKNGADLNTLTATTYNGFACHRLYRCEVVSVYPVTAGKMYTAAVKAAGTVSQGPPTATTAARRLEIRKDSDGLVIDSEQTRLTGGAYDGEWGTTYIHFIAPEGETNVRLVIGWNATGVEGYYRDPQLVQGLAPMRIAA